MDKQIELGQVNVHDLKEYADSRFYDIKEDIEHLKYILDNITENKTIRR